jgi:hypothetical protein
MDRWRSRRHKHLVLYVLLVSTNIWRTGAQCSNAADCIVGKYCNQQGLCADCSVITPTWCDAAASTGSLFQQSCCTIDILRNCPSNPHSCTGPSVVKSCTDSSASNYNVSASLEDGSCEYDCATLQISEAWGSGFAACYIFDHGVGKWPEGWVDNPDNSPTGCKQSSGPQCYDEENPFSECHSAIQLLLCCCFVSFTALLLADHGCCGRSYTPHESRTALNGSITLALPRDTRTGSFKTGQWQSNAGDGWIIQGRSLFENGEITYPELGARIEAVGAKLSLRFVRISNQFVKVCTLTSLGPGQSAKCPGPDRETSPGGGALYAYYAAISIAHVVFDGNYAQGEAQFEKDYSNTRPAVCGGAINALNSNITIRYAAFIGNTAVGGIKTQGGAISTHGANGILNISTAYFAGNTAPNPDTNPLDDDVRRHVLFGAAIYHEAAKPLREDREYTTNRLQLSATSFEPYDGWDTVVFAGSWQVAVGGCHEIPCGQGQQCTYLNYSRWCSKCPIGTVGHDGITCTPCTGDTIVVAKGCEQCSRGKVANNNHTECNAPACDKPGHVLSPAGECVCPHGMYDATNIALVCFYRDFHQSDVDEALAEAAEYPCQPCPPCASCSGDRAEVTVFSGFTMPSNRSLDQELRYRAAFRCDSVHSNDADAESSSCRSSLLGVQLSDGQRCRGNATGFLCESCDSGFKRNLGVCVACDGYGGINWLTVLVAVSIAVIFLAVVLRLCVSKQRSIPNTLRTLINDSQQPLIYPREQEDSPCCCFRFVPRAAVQPARIVITYFQVAAQLGQSLHTMLPPMFSSAVEFTRPALNVFNLFFSLDCAGDLGSFRSKWLLKVVALPLVLLGIVLLVYCCVRRMEMRQARLASRQGQRPADISSIEQTSAARRQAKELLFFVVFLVYPTVCNVAFSSLNCRQLSPTTSVLVDDDRVVCQNGDHRILQVCSVCVIVVFGIGVPGYFGTRMACTSWQYKQEKGADDLARQVSVKLGLTEKEETCTEDVVREVWSPLGQEFSFLLNAFGPRHYYWETLDMCRKFLLVGGVVLVGRGTTAQMTTALAVSLFFVALHTRTWPYKLAADNILRLLTELHVFVMIVIALALKGDLEDETFGVTFYDWLALVSFVVCVPLPFFFVVGDHIRAMMAIRDEVDSLGDGYDVGVRRSMMRRFKLVERGLASRQDKIELKDFIDLCTGNHHVLQWLREELELSAPMSDVAMIQQAYQRCDIPFDATAPLKTLVNGAAEAVAARAEQDELAHGVFLSHYQANGGPDLMDLKGELEAACPQLRIWYDKDEDPGIEQMRLGVRRSKYFVLYLTEGVLQREFCRKEIRWALYYCKTVLLVWKQDGRGAVSSFGDFFREAEKEVHGDDGNGLDAIFAEAAIPYYTDGRFHTASMSELRRRLGEKLLKETSPQTFSLSSATPTRFVLLYNPENGGPQARALQRELNSLCSELSDCFKLMCPNQKPRAPLPSDVILVYVTENVFRNPTVVATLDAHLQSCGSNGTSRNCVITVAETEMKHGWSEFEAVHPEHNGWRDGIQAATRVLNPTWPIVLAEAIPFYKNKAFRKVSLRCILDKLGAQEEVTLGQSFSAPNSLERKSGQCQPWDRNQSEHVHPQASKSPRAGEHELEPEPEVAHPGGSG